jgi:hypothetical protein
MYEMLEQMILAARRKRPQGWGNILFIVFLAISWAIGAILKAKSQKEEKKKTGERQLKGKPGGRAAEVTKKSPFQKIRLALEAELQRQGLQTQQPQRKLARPQPTAQKVAVKREPDVPAPALEPGTQKVQPEFQELPEFTDKAVRELKDKRIGVSVQKPQAQYLSKILLDYSEPDELKRAILHYEILGRPLSLRGPAGHIIGL